MSELGQALSLAAPIYNLGMVVIAFFLFLKLFRTHPPGREVFLKPWYVMFGAMMVYVVEEVITVLRQLGMVTIPHHINGFFELVIVSLIMYTLLAQRDWVKRTLPS